MARTTWLGAGAARVRRWPWALAATLAGAVAGTAVAYAARRVQGQDRPGAVEPEQVQAVVDRADGDGRPSS